jgi:FixJ family two-component response regulator
LSDRPIIFAVDDDPGFLASVVRLLRASGLEVKAFSSAEALQEDDDLSASSCFLLDIQLGGMSGIELSQVLRQQGTSAPIVFMTGNDSPAIHRTAMEQGCFAYLRKPFGEDDLIDAVTRAVAVRQ